MSGFRICSALFPVQRETSPSPRIPHHLFPSLQRYRILLQRNLDHLSPSPFRQADLFALLECNVHIIAGCMRGDGET